MVNAKPYVQAASVCERVLQEADGVLSAIRMVDKLTLRIQEIPKPVDAPADAQPVNAMQVIDLSLLVALKSGDLSGEFTMSVRMRDPN